MIKNIARLRFILPIIAISLSGQINAQCFQLYDWQGIPSSNPYWISCTGNDFTLFIQSPNNIGPYIIDWGDGSPNDTGSGLVPPNWVSHIYTATVDSFIVTMTDTVTGCVVVGVVVMEEPVNASIQIPIGGVTQVCAPDTIWFINSSTNVSPTTTFTWDFGDGTPLLVFDWTNWQDTIYHVYLAGTVNCETQVSLYAENYCSFGNPTVATFNPIQVYDIDDAIIQASNVLLCYPDTEVTFENISDMNCFPQGNVAQRYEFWNFGDYWGDGYDSTIGWTPWPPTFPITIAYPGIGTYDVILYDSNMCGIDTAYLTITIIPPPVAGFFASDDTICEGESITFTDTSTGGANSWYWDFGDGNNSNAQNPTHTYNNAGNYTVTLIVQITGGTASCTDTATFDVVVLPSPTAEFNPPLINACDSVYVMFTDASIGAVAWNWDFDNTNTSILQNPPQQFYGSSGIYTITLIVIAANGCTDQVQHTVNVHGSPVPNFQPFNVCADEISYFQDLSTSPGGEPIIQWYWDFDDGNTDSVQNPTNVYINAGTYNVILTVSTAYCTATDTFQVIVEPKPIASFTPDTTEGCNPLTITFTNTSTGAVNYFWDFGDGNNATLTNPVYTYINTGQNDTSFVVMLIASTLFGCADTAYDTITIHPSPSAGFTHDAILDCGPITVNFTNTSTGGVSYQWDFGDSTGSTLQDPTHIFQNQTLFIEIYTVTLVVISVNGCTDTATQYITVYPEPMFGFSIVPDSGCSPLFVTFPSVIGAVQYLWYFGDGDSATGPTPTHIFINDSVNNLTFTVTLIATNAFGCTDTTYGDVVVFPKPKAQFSVDTTSGCNPLTVTFQNNSTGAVNYYWDFDDGNTHDTAVAVFTHTFINITANSIIFNVELIAETQEGCRDTMSLQIEVYPEVIAAYTSDTIGCSPFPVTFTNQSTNATIYDWIFGDGNVSISTNPANTYANAGTYSVTLIATSIYGCADTTQGTVTVLEVVADFTGAGDDCAPIVVDFTNNSTNASSYLWNFGDGGTSTQQDPSYTYYNPGTYTVSLTAYCPQGQNDIVIKQQIVVVNENAIAYFDRAPATVVVPNMAVQFYNLSSYADSYLWDFGDGGTSTDEFPEHYYTGEGVYTVVLIADNSFGCADTFTIVNAVTAEEAGEIKFPNAFTPNNSGANGGQYDPRSFDNNIFFPVSEGVTDFHLMIFNRWGELLFESFDINIGWDGYYRDELCQQDVYVWKVKAKFANGEDVVKAGDVTLLR